MRRIQRLTLLLAAVVTIGLTGCAESVTGPAPLDEPPAVTLDKKTLLGSFGTVQEDTSATTVPLEPIEEEAYGTQRLLTRY